VAVARESRDHEAELGTRPQQPRDRHDHAWICREEAAKKRAPWEVDRCRACDLVELRRQALDRLDEEHRVLEASPSRAPGAAGQDVRARVDREREGRRFSAGSMENVAAVARAEIHENAVERGGSCRDLTDVYVDETLSEKTTHEGMVSGEPDPGSRCRGYDGGQHRGGTRCGGYRRWLSYSRYWASGLWPTPTAHPA